MTLSTRMGVMNHGQIVQVGTPSEIYEFPSSRFVADFIGSVNMFEGKLIEDEPDYVRIRCDDLGGIIHVNHGISSAPDATVWVAVRPEKINISRRPPTVAGGAHQPESRAGENLARGTVKEIAYMGDVSIYLVQSDSGKTIRVTMPNVARHMEDRITWGETVYVSWHAESPVVLTR